VSAPRPGLDATAGLRAVARTLLAADVAVAASDPRAAPDGLLPEEAAAVAAAVDRRRREFAAGRVAARQAMAELGVHGAPVRRGADRAPVWPDGVVGSIAHTATACLAAAALTGETPGAVRSVAVDLEPDAALEPALWASVCTAEELAWLDARPAAARARLARAIFSAKECLYKAHYPLTRVLHGFEVLRVELDLAAAAFTGIFLREIGGFAVGDRLEGRLAAGCGLILTAVTLRRAGP
jgi:4'-phosphopantetheinyl transferase EntD